MPRQKTPDWTPDAAFALAWDEAVATAYLTACELWSSKPASSLQDEKDLRVIMTAGAMIVFLARIEPDVADIVLNRKKGLGQFRRAPLPDKFWRQKGGLKETFG